MNINHQNINTVVYSIKPLWHPEEVKEAIDKGLVCPVLECSNSVWDPSVVGLQDEFEKVKNRAARFVTGNYNYETGSMTGILKHLKWESLKKQQKTTTKKNKKKTEERLILLYKGLMGKASIPTADLTPPPPPPPVRHCRNHHYIAYQVHITKTGIYECSFPPPGLTPPPTSRLGAAGIIII